MTNEPQKIQATAIPDGQFYRGVIASETDEILYTLKKRHKSSKKAVQDAKQFALRMMHQAKKKHLIADFEILDI